MEYRLNKDTLLVMIGNWVPFIKRKIQLVACGGTALTLMGFKESTKDVDFMVPDKNEYKYLINTLKDLGYKQVSGSGWKKEGEVFIIDLFEGNKIHTTELMESPLNEGNHIFFKELNNIKISIINDNDLIASKIFRGTGVDIDDCMSLIRNRKGIIDIEKVLDHVKELARHDISYDKIIGHIKDFIENLKEAGLYE